MRAPVERSRAPKRVFDSDVAIPLDFLGSGLLEVLTSAGESVKVKTLFVFGEAGVGEAGEDEEYTVVDGAPNEADSVAGATKANLSTRSKFIELSFVDPGESL